MTEAEQAAGRYHDGGLSVLPIRPDGSKAPWLTSWKLYQSHIVDRLTLRGWYRLRPEAGVGIVAGAVSGGLEVLDVDESSAYDQWREVALSLIREAGLILPRLPRVCTPTGGAHVFWRHRGEQQGNQKLATRRNPQTGARETVIETRGEGGYVVAPGSPAECHPSGRPYVLLAGDLGAVPVISPEARALLLDAARTLTETCEPEQVSAPRPRVADGSRPGDVYAARAEWDGLLRRHGWKRVSAHGATVCWRRPGKDTGISATTNHNGSGYLYVFSTNAPPFEAERGYSLFSAYALLDHGGDFRAAAVALAEQGYGTAPPPVVTEPTRGSARSVDDLLRRRLAAGSVR